MTPLQVKNKILQEFKGLHDLVSYMVMESKANHLIISHLMINRKGALYLCQKSSKVTLVQHLANKFISL